MTITAAFKRALVLCVAAVVAADYLTITNIADGDYLMIGQPYTVNWTDPNGIASDPRVLALLRCSTSWLATEFCDLVTTYDGMPLAGGYSFNASAALNDNKFYRFQLLNKVTMELATSGTFKFLPFPVPVDTT